MKAVTYSKYGPPEVLTVRGVDRPVAGDREILVRNHATTVTAGDWRMRKASPFMARIFNGLLHPKRVTILGFEVAGVVVETGKNVTRFKNGDPVFASCSLAFGGYAEYTSLPEDGAVALKPDSVPFAEAAAIPIGGLTALGFLRKARIAAGKKVLIYGASGCVGTYAVPLAKYFGAHVTGVCSTANLDLVRSLGADSVLDYTADEYYPPAKTYDIVFDAVGKSSILKAARSLKADGYFLNAYHIRPSHILSGIAVALFTNKHVIPDPGEGTADDLSLLGELAQSGTVKPVIDRRYTLDEIVEAHRYVEKGHKKGNVVITM